MADCVFCLILEGKLDSSIVYQDDLCAAFMDIQPVNPGHVLVIPKDHRVSLAELDQRVASNMFCVAQRIAAALRVSGIKCEGVNLFMADGEAAGQEVFHTHLHVFPRYRGDGFGLKFDVHYEVKPGREELNRLAEQIKTAL